MHKLFDYILFEVVKKNGMDLDNFVQHGLDEWPIDLPCLEATERQSQVFFDVLRFYC